MRGGVGIPLTPTRLGTAIKALFVAKLYIFFKQNTWKMKNKYVTLQ
jgi:hypothetical protein